MKPIAVDEFCRLRFLSNIEFSPEGKTACVVVTEADKKKNDYRSCIWVLRDGKFRKLTSFGKEGSFQYLDEDTLLFPGKRETGDAGGKAGAAGAGGAGPSMESKFYRISLSGGEAELAYTFPIPVSKVMPLPDGDLILAGTVLPEFPDLYKGDKKYLAAFQKHAAENADYEVIEQSPWWWNGGTYTKGAYTALFRYDKRRGSLTRLTKENENVMAPELSRDKKTVYYIASPVKPRLKLLGENSLCKLSLKSGRKTVLARENETFLMMAFALLDDFAVVLAADGKHGLNTYSDFYRLDYKTGELTLYAKHGESIGSSVGSDVRYGGGHSIKACGNTLYFISTRFDAANLYKLENGEISPVIGRAGSVDAFDVKDGKILAIALWDMKGQEVYDGKCRKISSFNAAVLRGKYVAEPEFISVPRPAAENGPLDGPYDVHGFVLKPIDYDPEKKYPVILDIHGGPMTVYGEVFYHEMQYWAGKGYFVIFCNPTGSDGRGDFMELRGKYGTVDFDDIMAFTDACLKAYSSMDKKNLFETGGSYGGFMTNWIIGHTDRFGACASQRSISNWLSFYGVSDIGVDFSADQNAADLWDDPAKLWDHSPLKYANKVKTPTLFIHSMEDYRCPIDQGYQMFTALVANGVESRLVCFRGENHELSRSGKPLHRLKRLNEITAWFDGHRK